MLSILIVIVWTQLGLIGLRMLSVGLYLAHMYGGTNLPVLKLQMAILEDLSAAHCC